MSDLLHPSFPPFIAPSRYSDAQAALNQVVHIYDEGVKHLRQAVQSFVAQGDLPSRVRACYPFVRIHNSAAPHVAFSELTHLSYGFVAGSGTYETTLTRPDIYADYYLEQFGLLLQNHGGYLEIGTSNQAIPVHFAFGEDARIEGSMDVQGRTRMRALFDLPDLTAMDDAIANGTHAPQPGESLPLSLFTAARVDYSLHRLRHYTGCGAQHFQKFVLLTNYQFYVDEFIRFARSAMSDRTGEYIAFVEPGNVITHRTGLSVQTQNASTQSLSHLPQMPGYHLLRADRSGITLVNIGVGPANAKNITDHIAVLRPHAWIMLGHCAGLRNSQQLGDYVLAHGYVREDHVLDEELPLWIPIPALAEIQKALEQAVADVTQSEVANLKSILRTGTVASTDNRNWELLPNSQPQRRFSQSRAIALDMESATIAANGFRFRVPYGTLLCVSDKPLHGEIKLPGMADHFYRERVKQHLRIGIRAVELLRAQGVDHLHSRKLRSFAEVAFQ